jgi:hypothetical protein
MCYIQGVILVLPRRDFPGCCNSRTGFFSVYPRREWPCRVCHRRCFNIVDAVEEPAGGQHQNQYKDGEQGLQSPPQPGHAAPCGLCTGRLTTLPVGVSLRKNGDEYTFFIPSKVDGVRVFRQGPQANEIITRH